MQTQQDLIPPMNIQKTPTTFWALAAALLLAAIGQSILRAAPRPNPYPGVPNIIYIMADDMGYSDIGCYGGEIQTPNIDRLASEGLRFRQFYNCGKCEITRSSLLSGRYSAYCGLLVENGTTLGAVMQSGGYQTYGIGKWHIGEAVGETPADRGFDNFFGFYGGATSYFTPSVGDIRLDCMASNNFVTAFPLAYFIKDSPTRSREQTYPPGYYSTDAFGDNAVASLDDAVANHTNRPFFMYLAFNAPHAPVVAPVALINQYTNLYSRGWDVLRQEKWERQKALGLIDPQWQLPPLSTDVPRWINLDAAHQDIEMRRRAVDAAMVDRMDQNIGKLLARLDVLNATTRPGIISNTIIMFCSDNGAAGHDNSKYSNPPESPDSAWNQGPGWAELSNMPFRYYKQTQLNGGVCTPLIVRWPQVVAPGTMTDEPGHVIDIMATVNDLGHCDYAAQKTPAGAPVSPMDGASLRPVFQGGTRPRTNSWGFEFELNQYAYIKGDWKISSFCSSPWRLYNLVTDRTETHNLRWEYPEIFQQLVATNDAWAPPGHTYAERVGFDVTAARYRFRDPITHGWIYPAIGLILTNIGTVLNMDATDQEEYYRFHTASVGVGNGSDNFTFFGDRCFGDGDVIAQIETATGTVSSSRGGVMVRQSLAAGSPFVMTAWAPGGQCMQTVRTAANGSITTTTTGPGIQLPVWLRLLRQGDVFTSSYSTNGYSWTDFATVTNSLGAEALGGLASSSGSTATTAFFQWREWENRHIMQYPQRARLVDGLPELLGYALGADENTDARNRQPVIQMTNVAASTYPQLNYIRRKNTNGLAFGYLGGAAPGALVEDSANWVQTGAAPGPDADSEHVAVRRVINAQTATNGFFRLKVGSQ